jgi:hypothetical protein
MISPTRKALLAGAKALRSQARPLAFDANLYARGLRDSHCQRAYIEYTRLLRYAAELEKAVRVK